MSMITNTRSFLRDFAEYKMKVRRGETVRIKDREGEYIFMAVSHKRRSLLGAAKGLISSTDDLSSPTLQNSDWKPGL